MFGLLNAFVRHVRNRCCAVSRAVERWAYRLVRKRMLKASLLACWAGLREIERLEARRHEIRSLQCSIPPYTASNRCRLKGVHALLCSSALLLSHCVVCNSVRRSMQVQGLQFWRRAGAMPHRACCSFRRPSVRLMATAAARGPRGGLMPGAALTTAPLPVRPACCTAPAGDDTAPRGDWYARPEADSRSSKRRWRLWNPALSCCSCACFQLDSWTACGAAGSAVRGAGGVAPALLFTFSLLADSEPGDARASQQLVRCSARLADLQRVTRACKHGALSNRARCEAQDRQRCQPRRRLTCWHAPLPLRTAAQRAGA